MLSPDRSPSAFYACATLSTIRARSGRAEYILRTFSRSVTAPSRLRQRASIILLAFDGLLNEDIAQRVGLTHRQVGRWRRR
jgi:hypothetical protein